MEEWREIPNYEGCYKVSNLGRLRTYKNNKWGKGPGKEMKGSNNGNGYRKVELRMNCKPKKFYIHKLVMLAFVGESNGLDVNHMNGIRDDNRLENLEYCTRSENIQHSFDVLGKKPSWLGKKGIDHVRSRAIIQYSIDKVFIRHWNSIADATRGLGINNVTISQVCSGKKKIAGGYIWKYLIKH